MDSFEYWKERCELAEEYIKYSPCDPDINDKQLNAWKKYKGFIETEKPNNNMYIFSVDKEYIVNSVLNICLRYMSKTQKETLIDSLKRRT